jgi:putative tricarboxylic transport membrane protein
LDQIVSLFDGFGVVLTAYNIGLMLLGILLGVAVGVMPVLGEPKGVAN